MKKIDFNDLENRPSPELIEAAQRWLHNEYLPDDQVKLLAKELFDRCQFSFARRLFEQLLSNEKSRWDDSILRQLAMATYQDDELPSDRRFDFAASLLIGRFGNLSKGEKLDLQKFNPERIFVQEVLGQLGAIYKRKWKFGSQLADLYRSLEYYKRGYELWLSEGKYDQFYTSINAAFVYDLLASTLRNTISQFGVAENNAKEFTKEADDIRQAIVKEMETRLSDSAYSYWDAVTLAEAYIGLGRPAEAANWLQKALQPQPPHPKDNPPPKPRQIEVTAFQLAELAQLRFPDEGGTYSEILLGIEAFFDPRAENAAAEDGRLAAGERKSLRFGDGLNRKVGLALSGGGFRASLFHIGVLAKLAELDLLRHIQVISCVSGGSIIGAYYYLELQKMLETSKDSEISASDYAILVKKIADEFLPRINGNLRTKALSNPWHNLKIACLPRYTRTTRMGELYEKELYSKVFDYDSRERKRKAAEDKAQGSC